MTTFGHALRDHGPNQRMPPMGVIGRMGENIEKYKLKKWPIGYETAK